MKTDDDVREIMDKACREHGGKYLREFAEEVIAMRQRIAELERDQMTLQQLIDQAISMRTEGNREFVLYYWDEAGKPPWTAHIGNPYRSVAMLEGGSDFSGKGDTAADAVIDLIKMLRVNRDS